MGIYFQNEELDGLWSRLVQKVEEITGITDITYPSGTVLVQGVPLGEIPDPDGEFAPQGVTSATLAYPVQAGKKYLLNGREITIPSSGAYGYNDGYSYFGIEDNIIRQGKSMGGPVYGEPTYYTLIAAEDVVVPHTGLRQLYRALADLFAKDPLVPWYSVSERPAGNTVAEYFTALAEILRPLNSSDVLTLEAMVETLEAYALTFPINIKTVENEDGTVTITSLALKEGQTAITIPSIVNGKRVKSISATNLSKNKQIETIIIGEGIEEIGPTVFYECNNVSTLTLSSTLRTVGKAAFNDLYFITDLNIPRKLTNIGEIAFSGAQSLENITVNPFNTAYYSVGNCLLTRRAPRELILGTNTSIIPQDEDIRYIKRSAFEDCTKISFVQIPSSVEQIDTYAFDGNTLLTSILISKPQTSLEIAANAFAACQNLQKVYYGGTTSEDFSENVSVSSSGNSYFLNAKKYYYSENEPTAGRYWHYGENGEIVEWDVPDIIEYELTLDSYLVLNTIPEFNPQHQQGDLIIRLYNTNGDCICEPIGADGTIPFDFAQWAQNNGIAIPAGEYYATAYDTQNSSLTLIDSHMVSYNGTSGGKGDVIATYTESQLQMGIYGDNMPALEVGKGYYVNDTYFVADGHGQNDETGDVMYAAPPSDTVITTEGNIGTMWYDPTGWGVAWGNDASSERTVTFYEVVDETYTESTNKN